MNLIHLCFFKVLLLIKCYFKLDLGIHVESAREENIPSALTSLSGRADVCHITHIKQALSCKFHRNNSYMYTNKLFWVQWWCLHSVLVILSNPHHSTFNLIANLHGHLLLYSSRNSRILHWQPSMPSMFDLNQAPVLFMHLLTLQCFSWADTELCRSCRKGFKISGIRSGRLTSSSMWSIWMVM